MKITKWSGLIGIVLLVLGAIGWVKNIIHLSNCDFDAPYKAEVIYGVGLIPIVGAVTGWIDIEDGKQEE